MTQHVFHFIAPINHGSASLLQDQMLNALQQGATSFEIRMCTDGGTTFHGFALYNLIRSMPVPVTTINVGNVESMGVVMYLAGSHRIAVPHSRFLLHPLNWGFNEGRVDHARLTEHGLSLDNDLDRYAGIFAERTNGANQPVDVRSCLKNNAKVLTPDDASAAGVSQEVRLVELAAESIKWWINVN